MKRSAIRSVLIGAGLLALAACGSSTSGNSGSAAAGTSSSSSPASASPAELKTANTSLGQVVVDAQGRTVYFFGKDTANSGKSVCGTAQGCIGLWPAVTTTSASPKVDGVTGQVGTITRDDGTKQLTLNGVPVYTFSGDSKAGDVNGQNYLNLWWVVSPSGTKITSAPQQGMQSTSSTPVY